MAYDVNIQRLGINALFDLQGDPASITDWTDNELPAFPEQPNTASQVEGISLYWIAPQQWLLRADISQEQNLFKILDPDNAPDDLSIVLVSDTVKFFQISGTDADDIISIASSIDHRLSAFPANGVSYTDFFGIKGLLARVEHGYEIAVESSYADMIEDYLTRANA